MHPPTVQAPNSAYGHEIMHFPPALNTPPLSCLQSMSMAPGAAQRMAAFVQSQQRGPPPPVDRGGPNAYPPVSGSVRYRAVLVALVGHL